MDISSLEIFLLVAEEASVTRAAQRLKRAPSNVTTRLQLLEEQLGAFLFSREGKRMSLTREGEVFADFAAKMVALEAQARIAVKQASAESTLRLGTMESTAASRLPPVIASFNDTLPQVSLQLTLGATQDLRKSVIAGDLDCALIAHANEATPSAARDREETALRQTPIYNEELLLILPSHHSAIQAPEDVKLPALAALEPGCTYRRIAERWLMKANISTLELGSYHSIMAHVIAGNALGVMPRSVLDGLHWNHDIKIYSLGTVTTVLASRADRVTQHLLSLETLLLASSQAGSPSSATLSTHS